MPTGFNVTAETLQADATRIATGASNIEGHLAFLNNAVTSVVNAGWIGSAAQSAAALHEKLDKAGRGGLARMLLDSVTDKVVRGTTRPVLVYRPTAWEATSAA